MRTAYVSRGLLCCGGLLVCVIALFLPSFVPVGSDDQISGWEALHTPGDVIRGLLVACSFLIVLPGAVGQQVPPQWRIVAVVTTATLLGSSAGLIADRDWGTTEDLDYIANS